MQPKSRIRCRMLLSAAAALLWSAGAAAGGYGERTVGTTVLEEPAWYGATLFTPLSSGDTFLVDLEGRVLHEWHRGSLPGQSVYLLDNGRLLRTETVGRTGAFDAGGAGGRIVELDWDGNEVWSFELADEQRRLHHDVEPLPNGHVLAIAWERHTREEAIAAGRSPTAVGDELWSGVVLEIAPPGEVVWEWRVWDHVIQDLDPAAPTFGDVGAEPGRVDLNYPPGRGDADWNHINSIDYNDELDHIVLSVHVFNEIWVIDHGVPADETSGPAGELLYRWGNPGAWRAGDADDQRLFGQHDAEWIPDDVPGGGNLLVFNNGRNRPDGAYSSVLELDPPTWTGAGYEREPGGAFGPEGSVWRWTAEPPTDFFADHISGAQRLPNGNTLLCDGPTGTFVEVTPVGDVVWRYVNPVTGSGFLAQGDHLPTDVHTAPNAVFRADRYPLDGAELAGRTLMPGDRLESYLQLPEAGFGIEPRAPVVGQGVRFVDASAGYPTSWVWSFGDGGMGSGPEPVHVFEASGSYVVELEVENPSGLDSATATLEVGERAPRRPTGRAGDEPASPLYVRVPSEGTGAPDGSVVVRVDVPKWTRYPEGAPVVVQAGGWFTGVAGFHRPCDVTRLGAVGVSYLWPGIEDPVTGLASEGTFDHGGPRSLEALRDVLRFASGEATTVEGLTVGQVAGVPLAIDNVGLFASSHSGVVATNVLARHGDDLTGVRYLIGRENPTRDEMYSLEIGYFDDRRRPVENPFFDDDDYSPTEVALDCSTVGWYDDGQSMPRPYFAADGERPRHVLHPTIVARMWGKRYYSRAILHALRDNGALTDESWPEDLATPEEADRDWPYRTTVDSYPMLADALPSLRVMLVFAAADHVQAAPSKPHIHQAWDGFFHTAGLWVRMNPDTAYVEAVDPSSRDAPDNPANTEPEDWSEVEEWGFEDGPGVRQTVWLASVAEMADRVAYGAWQDDLGDVLQAFVLQP